MNNLVGADVETVGDEVVLDRRERLDDVAALAAHVQVANVDGLAVGLLGQVLVA